MRRILIMDDVIPCRPITDHSIKGLARRCPKLTILSLAYLRRVTHETLEAVAEVWNGQLVQ